MDIQLHSSPKLTVQSDVVDDASFPMIGMFDTITLSHRFNLDSWRIRKPKWYVYSLLNICCYLKRRSNQTSQGHVVSVSLLVISN